MCSPCLRSSPAPTSTSNVPKRKIGGGLTAVMELLSGGLLENIPRGVRDYQVRASRIANRTHVFPRMSFPDRRPITASVLHSAIYANTKRGRDGSLTRSQGKRINASKWEGEFVCQD